jgi:uracil-DNA glycosylase family 4
MQFPSALDVVLRALEEMRATSERTPRASRDCLEQLLRIRESTAVVIEEASHQDVAAAATINEQSKVDALNAIGARVSACTKCPHLVSARTQTVFGVGNPDADIMFVGEAPGADEDRQGEPFVGKAGQLLTRIIETMGFKRGDVYIANVLKCRPDMPRGSSGNRPPTLSEMETCKPYLLEQIALIQPKVMVALGATAVEGLLGFRSSMGSLRGRWHDVNGTPLMITYHPAYLLRNQAPSEKRKVWEDMLLVLEKLERPISEKQRNYFL